MQRFLRPTVALVSSLLTLGASPPLTLAVPLLLAMDRNLTGSGPAEAADWPQLQRDAQHTGRTTDSVPWPYRIRWVWLGPEGTLRNAESEVGWPDDLTSRDGYDLPLPESVPFTLAEQAQPVVAGGRVFIGDQEGNVYAIDAFDGASLWTRPNPGGTVSAAAVSGTVVVFVSLQGFVTGFDVASGAQLWQLDTGRAITGAPLLHEGAVFIGNHGGTVLALDPSTGGLLWTRSVGAPVLGTLAASGGTVYVVPEDMIVRALSTASGTILAERQVTGQSSRMLWPVVQGGRVYVRTMMIPIVGSEYLLADLHAASSGPVDEQNKILEWYTGGGPFANASPDWRDCFVLDATTLAEPYVVPVGPTEGCGKPAEPPCVDNSGRVLLWWNTKYPTLTNTGAFGTNYSVDIAAVDPTTGRRVSIDNGRLAGTRQDVDNLYGLSVGGNILYLRQGWYGTMAIRLTDSVGRFVTAYDNSWVGYDVFYDGTSGDGDDTPQSANLFTEGRCPVTVSGSQLFLGEHFGLVALETDD